MTLQELLQYKAGYLQNPEAYPPGYILVLEERIASEQRKADLNDPALEKLIQQWIAEGRINFGTPDWS